MKIRKQLKVPVTVFFLWRRFLLLLRDIIRTGIKHFSRFSRFYRLADFNSPFLIIFFYFSKKSSLCSKRLGVTVINVKNDVF